MMSEADDAFLHVHLDHMHPKLWLRDYLITSWSAILVAKFGSFFVFLTVVMVLTKSNLVSPYKVLIWL